MAIYKLYNISRHHCMPHIPESVEHDHGMVYDLEQETKNPITGKMQPKLVFSGKMPACSKWIQKQNNLKGSK